MNKKQQRIFAIVVILLLLLLFLRDRKKSGLGLVIFGIPIIPTTKPVAEVYDADGDGLLNPNGNDNSSMTCDAVQTCYNPCGVSPSSVMAENCGLTCEEMGLLSFAPACAPPNGNPDNETGIYQEMVCEVGSTYNPTTRVCEADSVTPTDSVSVITTPTDTTLVQVPCFYPNSSMGCDEVMISIKASDLSTFVCEDASLSSVPPADCGNNLEGSGELVDTPPQVYCCNMGSPVGLNMSVYSTCQEAGLDDLSLRGNCEGLGF